MMDIKGIETDETKSLRIYYHANDENIYKGTALIFGPEGSIYHNLPVLLEIEFPNDYPFSNPKVKFVTYDGRTRFHPNLYVEGKVCLSILGTWHGPSWTSVMTLRTVLLSILGLLDEEPLLHEPGYVGHKGKPQSLDYSNFVSHSVLTYITNAIHKYSYGQMDTHLKLFEDEWKENLPKIYEDTLKKLEKRALEPIKQWRGLVYSMSGDSDYKNHLATLKAAGARLGFQKID